jgi:glyoxylase-like metal-dependent hydrolase (beta-lactamase superfamily II)
VADGTVYTVSGGSFRSNCYICTIDAPGECILIDPGLDGALIDTKLGELSLTPRFVFCTHGHFDHFGSASFFQKKYKTPVYMHAGDQKIMLSSNFLLMVLKIPDRVEIPDVTFIHENNFSMDIEGSTLRYIETPGHTPGSCLIEFGSAIFSGDTLYASRVGLSGLPGENHDLLQTSILRIWNALPEESVVYPGHGQQATFGDIKTNNRDLLAFLGQKKENPLS